MRSLFQGVNVCLLSALIVLTAVPALAQELTGDGMAEQIPAEQIPTDARPMEAKNIAVLQALDKITGRIHVLSVPVNQPARFASLDINVRSCRRSLPEDSPESAAFLVIDEKTPRGEQKRLFSGWMFASSPAISAMEHPMFDVWVIECRD